ncbi:MULTISPECIES: HemK/PrmC family methyltransferase [unclassified Adlercreutzia]|uniref:N5-glutamine methyltransferase family protein n=1 Tax=unclassified Adlercreutzia TaxID=2636013 RepID=UPI0013E9CAE9|nr:MULTISPECIES: HemK/PrmC family methyltransferase [unclassified Adlercreutzia]
MTKSENNDDIWTVKAALDWTCGYLERKGDENPRLSAQWLLSEACGLSRIELYVNAARPLSLDERAVLRGYVTRRGRGEPLQYITGEVGFRHITVRVRPGVLIPRPETEVLVSEVLAALPAPARPRAFDSTISAAEGDQLAAAQAARALGVAGEREAAAAAEDAFDAERASEAAADSLAGPFASASPKPQTSGAGELLVADICTGSGCIACSLAYEHAGVRVVATDIAPEAVALARENAETLGLSDRVEVLQGNLGDAIDPRLRGSFDAVVSNPPYVPTDVLAQIPREVAAFEPALALDGGVDGLDLFRPLATWAHAALKPGGVFAAELHEGHLDQAAEVARAAGFADVRVVSDLAQRPRVLVAAKRSALVYH